MTVSGPYYNRPANSTTAVTLCIPALVPLVPRFVLFRASCCYMFPSAPSKRAPLSLPSNEINYLSTYLEKKRRCNQPRFQPFWISIRPTDCQSNNLATQWIRPLRSPRSHKGAIPAWYLPVCLLFLAPLLTPFFSFHILFCNTFVSHTLHFFFLVE